MRLLFSLIVLLFICSTSTPAIAAADYSNSLALSAIFPENAPAQSALELKSDLGWDWLAVDFDGRLCAPPEDRKYSFVKLGFNSSYIQDLKLKIEAGEDDRHLKFSKEISYDWRLFQGLKGTISYSDGWRDSNTGERSKFYYNWDKADLALNLDFDFLRYSLNYSYNFNDYLTATYYSSIKNSLEQRLTWDLKQSSLTLSYLEKTGEYPFDLSYTRSYWKEDWDINIKHDFSKAWRCSLDYSQQEEEKGFKPYIKSKNYKAGVYFSPDKISDFSIEAIVNVIENLKNTVDIPDDWDEEINDPDENTTELEGDSLSCLKRKIVFVYQADFKWFLGVLGFYTGWDDYNDNEEGKISTGLYGTVKFHFQPVEVDLKIAPMGDQIQSQGYYQLKIKYEF